MRPRIFALLAGLVAGLLALTPVPGAPQAPTQEYQLKAVFLLRFAQFATWPDSVFAQPDAPLVIGIVGKDPFGPYLDETIRDEQVAGHSLVVRRFARVEDARDVQILFVGTDDSGVQRALPDLGQRHVLSVGDADTFAARGGVVAFVRDGNRIRLRINREAAEAAGLTLSSNLLRLAEIVTPRPN